jgi:type IV secretory pathway TrbD component
MDQPRQLPIHRSLNRPHLMMGGERELVLSAGILAGMVAFSGLSIRSVVMAIVLWVVCLMVFQRMAKADTVMSKIYIRHIRYKAFYPARPGVHAPTRNIPQWS